MAALESIIEIKSCFIRSLRSRCLADIGNNQSQIKEELSHSFHLYSIFWDQLLCILWTDKQYYTNKQTTQQHKLSQINIQH